MNAETMRQNADNCLVLAENAKDEPSRLRYVRMALAWNSLANTKDWLDGATTDAPLQSEARGHIHQNASPKKTHSKDASGRVGN
jgi:hypothetical protein